MKLDVKTLDGGTSGSVELDETIYGLEPRADILQRVVTWQLSRTQQGTHKSKGRSEIRGSSRKIVRQKGSGGARHGNKKAPLFRGGGKAHGPVVRSHATDLPKKVRKLGLKIALSAKARANAIMIVDTCAVGDAKTKVLAEKLQKLDLRSALVIDAAVDENFARAAKNIPLVDVLPTVGLNVRDILRRETLVLTKAAVEQLEARLK